MHKSLSVVLLIATSTIATAQMRGGFHPPGFSSRTGFARHENRGFGNGFFFSQPFLGDYPSGSMAYTAPQPPITIAQPLRADSPEPRPEPLMIEWQGNRFVRFGDTRSSGKVSPDYSEKASLNPGIPQTAARRELPPAVLIFRDGHREEVSDYVISRGILYARADYSQTGSWRRDIALATVDLPATLRTNREIGVPFALPAGPNEVVTRP